MFIFFVYTNVWLCFCTGYKRKKNVMKVKICLYIISYLSPFQKKSRLENTGNNL